MRKAILLAGILGLLATTLIAQEIKGHLNVGGNVTAEGNITAGSEKTSADTVYYYGPDGRGVRWAGSAGKWQYSNDGTTWNDLGSGGGWTPPDTPLYHGDLDTDSTLSANSDVKIATQKAVKGYVDNQSYKTVRALAMDGYTKLLIHADLVSGDTHFIDNGFGTAKTITPNGNVSTDTTNYKFDTGGSILCQTTGSDTGYLTLADNDDWFLSSGNFTFDCWVRFSSLTPATTMFFSQTTSNSSTNAMYFFTKPDNVMHFKVVSSSVSLIDISCAWTPELNTWYHVALVRKGVTSNGWFIFINGVSQPLTLVGGSYSVVIPDFTGLLYLGGANFTSTYGWFLGQMDEPRWSKGVARWESNFTPPTIRY